MSSGQKLEAKRTHKTSDRDFGLEINWPWRSRTHGRQGLGKPPLYPTELQSHTFL